MNQENISVILNRVKSYLAVYGIKVAANGKKLEFDGYDISIVLSKHGYEKTFGLSFFLRAENKQIEKDEWGNFDIFDEKNLIDFTPKNLYAVDKSSRSHLKGIYGDKPKLLSQDRYFCAINEYMLEQILEYTLPKFAAYLSNK